MSEPAISGSAKSPSRCSIEAPPTAATQTLWCGLLASEVRKRLAQYYNDPENAGQIRIEVPVGSYVPAFHSPCPEQPAEKLGESGLVYPTEEHPHQPEVKIAIIGEAQPGQASPSRHPRRWMWLTLAAVLALLAGIGVEWRTARPNPPQSGFDAFWAPVLSAKETPLISIGEFRTSQVEILPNSARNHIDRSWMLGKSGNIPGGIKALIFAHSISATKIAMLLARKNMQVELRPESETDYADLCKRSVILIGPYDNDWTIRLTDSMRFRFEIDFAQKTQWIADRDQPTEKIGTRDFSDYLPKTFEDNAIVARTINTSTGHPAIILAGLSPLGTTSATEFVSDPKYLNNFARQAPRGWEHKNIEFLISTSSVDGVTGPPQNRCLYSLVAPAAALRHLRLGYRPRLRGCGESWRQPV